MSDTTPGTFTAAPPAPPKGWPMLTLRWGRSLLEIEGASLFARVARVEVYARTRASYDPRWDRWREPGSFEAYAFGLALTVSWAPVSGAGERT